MKKKKVCLGINCSAVIWATPEVRLCNECKELTKNTGADPIPERPQAKALNARHYDD